MTDERRRRDAEAFAHTSAPDARMTPEPDPDGTLDLPASDQVLSSSELAPGQKIGHFSVRALLGEGGMGVVVAGVDEHLGRPVAIKLVRGDIDHPAYRARLLREAQAMAKLEHPNVVRVYEIGSDRGRTFVAMELIDGVTLTTWLKVQRRTWRDVVAMFVQVGAGLAAVHRVGLVHRDFKPDNVLVDRDGRAKVADFGLARFDPEQSGAAATVSPEMGATLTRTGMMMGTPGYMAPEQQFGGDVDARADQYSFCVALREALLGGRPKQPEGIDWGNVPRTVRAIVNRGLSYDAAERYPSMDEVLVALGRAGTRRRAMLGAVIAGAALCGGIAAAAVVATRDGDAPAKGSAVAVVVPADAAVMVSVQPSIGDAAVAIAPVDAVALAVVSPREGSGVAVPAPRDAGTSARDAALVAKSVPRDAASVAVAHVAPGEGASAGSASPPAGSAALVAQQTPPPAQPIAQPGMVPIMGRPAWSARTGLPAAANPKDPAHRAVVGATIKGLGYDGYDPNAKPSDVATATDEIEKAIAQIKVAMIDRNHGHCERATPALVEARKALGPNKDPVWLARSALTLALCLLADGKIGEAENMVHYGWVNGNRPEVAFVMAITRYEMGETDVGYAMFLSSAHNAPPVVRAAIDTWVAGTGLTVP